MLTFMVSFLPKNHVLYIVVFHEGTEFESNDVFFPKEMVQVTYGDFTEGKKKLWKRFL